MALRDATTRRPARGARLRCIVQPPRWQQRGRRRRLRRRRRLCTSRIIDGSYLRIPKSPACRRRGRSRECDRPRQPGRNQTRRAAPRLISRASAVASDGASASSTGATAGGASGAGSAPALGGGDGSSAGGDGNSSAHADYARNPPPLYPAVARRREQQGTVTVRVLVGADGSVEQAELADSSGFDTLDDAALDTVRSRWRFVPARRGGVAVESWVLVPIRFALIEANAVR